jgi:hypothetical protein
MPRQSLLSRAILRVEELERRLVLIGPRSIAIPLNPLLDQFGDQIVTVQAYGDSSRATFGVFDTGAAALTFSAADQLNFASRGLAIPAKLANGAMADGVGGSITGDVSQPDNVLAGGLHAARISFDSSGNPVIDVHFGPGDTSVAGVQTFVGTNDGSSRLPTITGTPILNPTKDHPGGLAALINMQGALLDFSAMVPGLILALPDLNFAPAGTSLLSAPGTTDSYRIPLSLTGGDNHDSPGNAATEAQSPIQTDITLLQSGSRLAHQQFLFDTGSQLTVISSKAAAALGLDLAHPVTTISIEGVGGTVQVPGYVLDELDIPTADGGQVQLTHVPVYVTKIVDGTDGVLGMNLFNSAASMLYDPLGSAGASLNVTFYTAADRNGGDRSTPNTVASLQGLHLGFAGAVHTAHEPDLLLRNGQIIGEAFLDYNTNGKVDRNEPGLGGATVFLDTNNNGRLDQGESSTITDQKGFYTFTHLAPGSYTVREIVPQNFVLVSPSSGFASVIVVNERITDKVNFGHVPVQSGPQGGPISGGYGGILDRPPDQGGLNNWQIFLGHGGTFYDMYHVIWNSNEHLIDEIIEYYEEFLLRDPDLPGLAGWLGFLNGGGNELDMELAIVSSQEYQALHSGGDANFLDGLYQDLLGRAADVAGKAGWTQALKNGMNRSQVAKAILTSHESYARMVDNFYMCYLHRQADDAGRAGWVAMLENGHKSLGDVAAGLLSSMEFLTWTMQFSK